MSSSDVTRARAIRWALALAVVLGASCEPPLEPLRPRDAGPRDASRSDAGVRFGCPVLRDPVALPGDDIEGDAWESFAQGFFESYCTRCHSVTRVTREERSSAPEGLDWDDEGTVRANLDRIRNAVGVQNFMPPSDPSPSCDERLRLIRWIDAGAP